MKRNKSNGFTLVELMVSLTIGLIILAAVSSVFVTSKRSYNEQDRQAKMQENARFALNTLMHDLRHAGYYGCMDDITSDTVTNTVNAHSSLYLNALYPIEGLDDAAAGKKWYPGDTVDLPAGIKPGTDALIIRTALADNPISLSSAMPNSSAELKVTSTAGLSEGDIVLISDCSTAAIFQLTAVQSSSLHLQHNTGSNTPGNSTKDLGKSYMPPASVLKFVSRVYYVREVDGVPTLYRKDNHGAAVPLVDGVEQMQITYGKDTDTPIDDIPNLYLRAGQAGLQTAADWERVRTVRLGLLVRTTSDRDLEENVGQGDLDVNGFTISADDVKDRNRRRVYHVTVNLRNLL
jgi:type IV pilus assembly protein PilW